ncbi:MAG: endolytic transglycosylase MltG, partial [Clostridia bacterium]|nr:endolytic transglycosylase MltG [Clostridia bacterium]
TDLSKDIERLDKLYFQEAEPGEPEPTLKPAATRQTGSRSTPRRKSASNASRARQTKTTGKKESSGKTRKNPFAARSEKTRTTKKKTRTAQKAASSAAPQTDPDKLVFTPLPPEGYAEPAENQTAARASALASEATGTAKHALDTIGNKGAVYISDTKRSVSDMRRRTAENAYRRRNNMKGMSGKEKAGYMLSQIGPTVRSIRSDPKRREAAYKILIVLIALLLAIHWTSCINDILGFARSDKEKVVVVEEGDTTNKLIGKFDRAGLIKHGTMCKLFIAMTSDIRNDNDKYLKGEFTLTPDMGIEKMLSTCTATQKRDTVEITFPEGFTVEQIAQKLEESKVCSRSDFLKATNSSQYDYDFLKDINNGDQRYHLLEGYMYPDTYEFYVGEDASSVVSKLLNNFSQKWSDSYEARAKQLNMSMDDVITLASIVQKEDSNPDNMAVIASVFYNRLNSSAYPSLQSDATNYYVNTYIKPNASSGEYNLYRNRYSTYVCKGLPVGPICSPGDDAIKSVLWPASTNYYFFAHDDDGNLYAARTASEQSVNVYNALTTGGGSDEEEEEE